MPAFAFRVSRACPGALAASTVLAVLASACSAGAASSVDAGGGSVSAGVVVTVSPGTAPGSTSGAVVLVIDEESIDNGNPPNNFSETDVNDQIADIGQRAVLRYFRDNVGRTIDLFTGQVGDEGWHALKTIPSSWRSAGPTSNGTRNYLAAGPGLGAPVPDDDREVLLEPVPDVTPLRAAGLASLVGRTVCAVVHDSDVSINYSPLVGNLQGQYLGRVAFEVVRVAERRDGSSSDLPRVTIRIADTEATCAGPLVLFANAPTPRSSSEPFDIRPPVVPAAPRLEPAP